MKFKDLDGALKELLPCEDWVPCSGHEASVSPTGDEYIPFSMTVAADEIGTIDWEDVFCRLVISNVRKVIYSFEVFESLDPTDWDGKLTLYWRTKPSREHHDAGYLTFYARFAVCKTKDEGAKPDA